MPAGLKDVVQEQREGRKRRGTAVESLRVVLRCATEKVVVTDYLGIGAPTLVKWHLSK